MAWTLTRKQAATLDMIVRLTEGCGRPPSMRELGAALGICRSAACLRVGTLVRRGAVVREAGDIRGLSVRRPYVVDQAGRVTPLEHVRRL
ncbi:MAG TPA: hypothetical protein VF406_04570 [Thermodesulfobacteriota bacterium]